MIRSTPILFMSACTLGLVACAQQPKQLATKLPPRPTYKVIVKNNSYCEIYKPIGLSPKDARKSIRGIRQEDGKYYRTCKKKPRRKVSRK